jgi:hypothetical protein
VEHVLTDGGANNSIGEISLMKDLTKTMEIMKDAEEEEENEQAATDAEATNTEATPAQGESADKPPVVVTEPASDSTPAAAAAAATASAEPGASESETSTPSRSQTSTPRPKGVPSRLLLTDKSDEDVRLEADMSEREQELKRKEKNKKGGLSQEQRAELAAYEAERKKVRQERVDTLTRKLIDRISVWTETDKGTETTNAFKEKTKYEVENLKMESFGIDILHGRHPDIVIATISADGFPSYRRRLRLQGYRIHQIPEVPRNRRILQQTEGQGNTGQGNMGHHLHRHRRSDDHGGNGQTRGKGR